MPGAAAKRKAGPPPSPSSSSSLSGRSNGRKGFDARYALPTQEEQQVLRQLGLDASTLRRRPAAAAAPSVDSELKSSLMGTEDTDAGSAASQSGLEVAHNSSLWGVQTKDLLQEMTFDYGHTHDLTAALRAVKEAVDGMAPRAGITRSTVDPRFMCAFLRREEGGDEVALDFAPPAAVDVVGSFLIRTQVRGADASVDVALEMPDECLDAKDYLNNRYFEKRGLYLALVAETLEQQIGDRFHVSLSYFRDDERKSMIVLRARDTDEESDDESDDDEAAADADGSAKKKKNKKKKKKKKMKKKRKKQQQQRAMPAIRILASVSPSCASLTLKRLRPGRTNVRVHGHTYGEPGSGTEALPTPHYSAAVVEDLCFKTHLQQLHAVAQKFPGFSGAVVLLKLWLARRRYRCDGGGGSAGAGGDDGDDDVEVAVTDVDCAGVNGFFLSMVLLHLAWQHKVQPHMQPLQMFRVVLQFLGQRKGDADVVLETGIVMCPRDKLGEAKLPTADELSSLRALFDVVMLECVSPLNRTVRLNLAARVSREALADLAWEARRSTVLLQSGDPVRGFQALFLADHGLADRFDQLFTVRFPAAPPRLYAEDDDADGASGRAAHPLHPVNDALAVVEAACDLGWRRACEVRLAKLVRRGLGDRVQGFRIVRAQQPDSVPEDLSRHRRRGGGGTVDNRAVNAGHTAVLGLLLDDDEAFRQVDKGPPATDTAAVRAFRLFWGARAQLRRFKDGSILETVVWGGGGGGGGATDDDAPPPRLAHTLPGAILQHLTTRHFAGCTATSTVGAFDHLVRSRGMDVQAPPDPAPAAAAAAAAAAATEGGAKKAAAAAARAAKARAHAERAARTESGDTLGGGGRGGGAGEKQVGRTQALMQDFRRLEQALKSMAGVELKVEAVRPASAEFAYAALMPPRGVPTAVAVDPGDVPPVPAHAIMNPLRVVVSFEASMRWPGTDSAALAACKTAFYLKMARALQGKFRAVARARPLPDRLEVQLSGTGTLFHVAIGLERAWEFAAKDAELAAVARSDKTAEAELAAAPGGVGGGKSAAALRVLAANKRAAARRKEAALGFQQVPAMEREERHRVFHVGVMHGVAVQHRAFSPAVRLAKLWVARAAMMSGHVPDEAVELLVAHTFADPGPFDEPRGAATALLRFLKLVATFDWAGEPLIVDLDRAASGRGASGARKANRARLSGDAALSATATTDEERAAVRAAFRRLRAQRPDAAAMCIVGPAPPRPAEATTLANHLAGCKGPLWTVHAPGRAMLQRLVKLAGATAARLERLLLLAPAGPAAAASLSAACDAQVFAPPPDDAFDVVLHLRRNAELLQELAYGKEEAAAARRLRRRFKNAPKPQMGDAVADHKWPGGFHPARRFVEDLSRALGQWAVVCHNACDWDRVGIVWRPARFTPARFKLSHASCAAPVALPTTAAAAAAGAKKSRGRDGRSTAAAATRTHTVPDVFQLLATASALGEGLVASVQVTGGGAGAGGAHGADEDGGEGLAGFAVY